VADCQATEATADLFLWLLANPMAWTGVNLQEKRGDRDERPVALAAMASDREHRVEICTILLNARLVMVSIRPKRARRPFDDSVDPTSAEGEKCDSLDCTSPVLTHSRSPIQTK
jgi:hypothetical protein